jgi:hypothetical protein
MTRAGRWRPRERGTGRLPLEGAWTLDARSVSLEALRVAGGACYGVVGLALRAAQRTVGMRLATLGRGTVKGRRLSADGIAAAGDHTVAGRVPAGKGGRFVHHFVARTPRK